MSTNERPVRTIASIERLPLSRMGNPRFHVMFTDGSGAMTQSDASIGYEIGNAGMREGCTVTVQFSRAGRITNMSRHHA